MAKENQKLGFGDLSFVLKVAVIAGWFYLAIVVLNLVSVLLGGGF